MATHVSIPTVTPVPLFVADEVALDFINTAYGVGPNRMDCLGSDQQVLQWLKRTGFRTGVQAVHTGAQRGLLLDSALALRETTRELIERRKVGAGADVAALNRVLALGETH